LHNHTRRGILFRDVRWLPDLTRHHFVSLWLRQEAAAILRIRLRDLPNIISLLRLLAVMPVVYLLVEQQFGWALLLFAAAGLSDGLDGFLAKHYGWQSHLGGILDPLADKVLLVACFLVLGALSLIPVWLVAAAVFRDLLIVAGAVLYNYRVEELQAAPLAASKLNTLLQILLIVIVITDAGVMPLPGWVIKTLIWACLGTVIASGAQYVWIWSRKAAEKGWKED
jgi:cardiolipin synthase